jgi:hypothetical protein
MEATMLGMQWKVCATAPAAGDPHWTVHVYVREQYADGTFGEWHHVVTRSKFDDHLMPTRGHALKRLVSCLSLGA